MAGVDNCYHAMFAMGWGC